MTRRGTLGLLATAAVATLVSKCGTSTASYRYRMRVEGTYTGTAVYRVLAEKTQGQLLPDEKPGGSMIQGQALVVETTSGPVFVLMQDSNDLVGAITRALMPTIPWNGQPSFWEAVNRLSRAGDREAEGELMRPDWPMLVRFRDINDSKSVEQVDPDAIGVRRVWVETTSDPVTKGIEERLHWLGRDPLTLGKDGQMGPAIAGGYLSNRSFLVR